MKSAFTIALALLSLVIVPGAAFAQTEPATPVDPSVPPVTNASGTVQLYCAILFTATGQWVQVFNAGTETAEPGMNFRYRTVGEQGAEGEYELEYPVKLGQIGRAHV